MTPSGHEPGNLYHPTGGLLGSGQHRGVISFDQRARWTNATASSLNYCIPEWWFGYNPCAYISTDTTPAWTGATPGAEFYNFQGWTGQNYARTLNLVANDLDHASDWLLQFYTPPPLITIDVSGTPTDFEFVRIGGAPRCADTNVTVPVASPASFEHSSTYDTNGELELAVVYRVAP